MQVLLFIFAFRLWFGLADVPVHVVPDDGIEIVLPSFHKSPDGYLQVCWVIYS